MFVYLDVDLYNKKITNMRISALTVIILVMISCSRQGKSSNNNSFNDNQPKTDTVKIYWEPDFKSYVFDTTINQTVYKMKTYCLNDSNVFNETISSGKVEYYIAHNYKTDFVIKTENSQTINISILKENFKDSLPTDFYKICHMWKNNYSHIKNGQLIFRATLAKPDTDYQMAVLYSISDKGKMKILKVVDETYNGDEED